DEKITAILGTDSDGTQIIVRMIGDRGAEPKYELELCERAGGRLAVMVLKREGEYLMELALYRFKGTEPFGKYKHSFRTIIDHYFGDRGSILPGRFPVREIVDLFVWILSYFRYPVSTYVSRVPFRYHLDIDRPLWAHDNGRPIGVASIYYNRTEPPVLTGSETEEQWEYNITNRINEGVGRGELDIIDISNSDNTPVVRNIDIWWSDDEAEEW
ncbi:hypothetical protein FRX31_012146, partial [Thalictrum thalictroides]